MNKQVQWFQCIAGSDCRCYSDQTCKLKFVATDYNIHVLVGCTYVISVNQLTVLVYGYNTYAISNATYMY